MGSALDFTLLTADDWRRYRDIRLASLADAPYAFGSTLASVLSLDEAGWRERAARNVLVASTPSGKDIGIISVWVHPAEFGQGALMQMWVDPAARGFGIGRALVEAAVDRARELGITTLGLHVTVGNDRATRLYESMGWAVTGKPEPLDPDDLSRGTVRLMIREIG